MDIATQSRIGGVGAPLGSLQLLLPLDAGANLVVLGHHGVELAFDLRGAFGRRVVLDLVELGAGIGRNARLLLTKLLHGAHGTAPVGCFGWERRAPLAPLRPRA